MSNGEFQGKYVHFNIIPNSDEIDQCIVSKPLVYEIASHHVMTTSHETGLTAPQEPSPLGRQEHAQQAHALQLPTNIKIQMSCLAKNTSNLTLHLLLVRYHTCTKINCSSPFSNLKSVH